MAEQNVEFEAKIRADERAKIVASLRRNRPQRDWSQYSMGYRDGITDTITLIEQETHQQTEESS